MRVSTRPRPVGGMIPLQCQRGRFLTGTTGRSLWSRAPLGALADLGESPFPRTRRGPRALRGPWPSLPPHPPPRSSVAK